jgi:acetylornithine deacetylase/succinyl-diaminopimelate desuccinylase-like protein
MTLFQLTRRLIDIPSTSGAEFEVGNFIADYLERIGFNVELQEVQPGRSNVIATTNAQPRVVLSTHMDTVPPFIPSSEDEQFIYGRGACDAKGIIAAQIEAANRLRESGYEQIGLLFTVDEELGSLGARAANDHPLASQCEYLINGEPTDNLLATGSKGSLRARIKTVGKAAHSAYPEAGESAIDKLLSVLERIRRTEWPVDQFFGETTCNIGVLEGGTRPNVIAAAAHADIQIRLVEPSLTAKTLLEEAVEHIGTVEYLSIAEPVRMHAVSGLEQTVVRFTTDIPYLRNWGRPLLLGPGSILVAHTENERVSKRELAESVELYTKLVEKLAAG